MKFLDNIAIIAPHPDDEILGCGGMISRLSKIGSVIHILFVSGHLPPLYKIEDFEITYNESLKALNLIGVKKENIKFLKIPATLIGNLPIHELNSKIERFIYESKAQSVFSCFPDRHIDHKLIFESTMVATRPNKSKFPKWLFLYETLSETHWNIGNIEPNFIPNFFVDITDTIDQKIEALICYKSQINNNLARSDNAVKALAEFRGTQNGTKFAEAFQLVRGIY